MSNFVKLPQLSSSNITSKELSDYQRRFNFYLSANELSKKEETVKVAHLRLGLDDRLNDLIDSSKFDPLTTAKVFE